MWRHPGGCAATSFVKTKETPKHQDELGLGVLTDLWPRRALREEVYRAYITRGCSGSADNGPIIESTLALRREQARMVGLRQLRGVLHGLKGAQPWHWVLLRKGP